MFQDLHYFACNTKYLHDICSKKKEREGYIRATWKQRDRMYEKFDITSEEIPSLFAGFRFIPVRRAPENEIRRDVILSHLCITFIRDNTISKRNINVPASSMYLLQDRYIFHCLGTNVKPIVRNAR